MASHSNGFITQPIPEPGKIEWTSVVFPWKELIQLPVSFSKQCNIFIYFFEFLFSPSFLENFTYHGMTTYSKLTYQPSYLNSLFSTEFKLTNSHPVGNPMHYIEPKEKLTEKTRFFSPFNLKVIEEDVFYQELLKTSYFIQYLVRYLHWSYQKIPIQGLSHLITNPMHSPTYCVASGGIWFDHPVTSLSSCNKIKFIDKLHVKDPPKNPKYDWKEYEKNNRMCLRFTKDWYYQELKGNSPIVERILLKYDQAHSINNGSLSSSNSVAAATRGSIDERKKKKKRKEERLQQQQQQRQKQQIQQQSSIHTALFQ
jgi:hypothetical protein